MTLHQLNQYKYICREIPDLRQRIRGQKKLLGGHHEVMASMDEFPYIRQTIPIGQAGLEDIRDTVRMMERRLRRIIRKRKQIEAYIDAIDDSQLRQIFQLRFVDGLSWRNVTIKIGGGNCEDWLKKRVYRYLKFVPQCPEK